MKNKPISFNLDNEKEKALYDHAQMQGNFSKYIKQLMAYDIQKAQSIKASGGLTGIRI
jgi:hypothetical protein